jgi:hypothetical protein
MFPAIALRKGSDPLRQGGFAYRRRPGAVNGSLTEVSGFFTIR